MTAILLSVGTTSAAYGAVAMIFLFQIALGFGFLPIVSYAEINTKISNADNKRNSTALVIPCRGRHGWIVIRQITGLTRILDIHYSD